MTITCTTIEHIHNDTAIVVCLFSDGTAGIRKHIIRNGRIQPVRGMTVIAPRKLTHSAARLIGCREFYKLKNA
jgi:MOSC domain-containing protein YiiM